MSSSDGRAPRRHRRGAAVLLLAAATLLGGCGFHLRGETRYAFDTAMLGIPPTHPLANELRRALEGTGTVRLVAAAEKPQVTLDIYAVKDDKEILSLSAGGKVREFLLTKRLTFRVVEPDGVEWLPLTDIIVRRTYTYNDTETLAKEIQEQRLFKEMQTDAVQQLLRRLQAVRRPA